MEERAEVAVVMVVVVGVAAAAAVMVDVARVHQVVQVVGRAQALLDQMELEVEVERAVGWARRVTAEELVVTVAHRVGELAARWAVAATGSRGRGLARRARSKRCCP